MVYFHSAFNQFYACANTWEMCSVYVKLPVCLILHRSDRNVSRVAELMPSDGKVLG